MLCALSSRSLSWNTPVFSRFTSREHANFIGCHFFHTHVLSHLSKAQLLRYCGKRSFLGVAKSWKATPDRVPWFGRHVENLGDVIIYPVVDVARTLANLFAIYISSVIFVCRLLTASFCVLLPLSCLHRSWFQQVGAYVAFFSTKCQLFSQASVLVYRRIRPLAKRLS